MHFVGCVPDVLSRTLPTAVVSCTYGGFYMTADDWGWRPAGSCTPQFGSAEEMTAPTAFCRGDSQGNVVENARLIQEVMLWWCVWGEAANMRFMPEFVCWVFYGMVQDLAMDLRFFDRHKRNYLVQVKHLQRMWPFLQRSERCWSGRDLMPGAVMHCRWCSRCTATSRRRW